MEKAVKIRKASNNERRSIMRHALGFYRALTITGLYSVHQNDSDFDARDITSYFPVLKWCIAAQPALSAAIEGEGTEEPEFVRPTNLDLRNHVQIIDPMAVDSSATDDDLELLKQTTLMTHDSMFKDVDKIPPWKIVVLPRPERGDYLKKRFYVLFSYSHSLGDGKSGLAFHRNFLQGLKSAHNEYDRTFICKSNSSPLAPPLEEACTLKVSWSYLSSALLGEYLPDFSGWWSKSQSPVPWTGKPIEYDPINYHTGSEILVIEDHLLKAVLRVCREQGAKFTGLFNQLIIRALSKALPKDMGYDSLIGQIAIDLRALVPAYSNTSMVNCVSIVYESSPRVDEKADYGEIFWKAARKTTDHLANSASSLVDQPIGLLRYISNFRTWYLGKLGEHFDSSYEISNLGIFDPNSETKPCDSTSEHAWDIEGIIFSQPANVTGCPLSFQIVTRKGGDMIITNNWQLGILGVPDENAFTKDIMRRIKQSLIEIATDN